MSTEVKYRINCKTNVKKALPQEPWKEMFAGALTLYNVGINIQFKKGGLNGGDFDQRVKD